MPDHEDVVPSGEASTTAPARRDWGEDEERALRVWIALARCYFTVSRSLTCTIAGYGLTGPQFGILEALHHLGPLSLGELAEKLLVTGGNVTYVMDRLEEQGLVYRDRSGEDRRVVQAKLTPEGQELISGVFPSHTTAVRDVMSELSHAEQENLRRLLKKLGKGIGEGEPAGRPTG